MTYEEARDLIAEHLDYGGSLDSHALAVAISASGVALESRVLAERKEPVNQCDGCRVGAPMNRPLMHTMPDGGFMACTASRYLAHPTPDDAFVRGLKVAREFALYEATHGPNGHALSSIDAAIDAAMQADKETKDAQS